MVWCALIDSCSRGALIDTRVRDAGVHTAPAVTQSRLSALPVAVWACVTATSRVAMGRHYVADVVVGCVLGVLEFQAVRRVAPICVK